MQNQLQIGDRIEVFESRPGDGFKYPSFPTGSQRIKAGSLGSLIIIDTATESDLGRRVFVHPTEVKAIGVFKIKTVKGYGNDS